MMPWFIERRKTWLAPHLDDRAALNAGYNGTDIERTPAGYDEANLVSSLINAELGLHMPVLDLDFPCALVPSTTEGHYHLYMNKVMTWREYRRLLRALHSAGLIERGFCHLAVERGMTFVRRPGVKKKEQGTK